MYWESSRFNSQASYEARRWQVIIYQSSHTFQFTGLIRGPTSDISTIESLSVVSIHRPHTRPDCPRPAYHSCYHCFNSQASYEARRPHHSRPAGRSLFQFTGLIRGPTRKRRSNGTDYGVSIHRPHTRPDEQFFIREFGRDGVSIRRPHTRPDAAAA